MCKCSDVIMDDSECLSHLSHSFLISTLLYFMDIIYLFYLYCTFFPRKNTEHKLYHLIGPTLHLCLFYYFFNRNKHLTVYTVISGL